LVEFALANAVVVVILKEGKKLETAEAATCVAINSLEGGVGCKVPNLAKSLAEALELAFTVTDSHQQILESVL
jgi:hypothetical protein